MPPTSGDKPKVIFIKKKGGGHGHHGGAWKVAYADFVTAMMALFIVLWLLATSTPQAKKDIARYFRENGIFKGGQTAMVPGPGGPKVVEPAFEPKTTGAAHDLAKGKGDAIDVAARELQAQLDRAMSNDPVLSELRKQVLVSVTPEGLLIQLIDNDRHKDLMFDLSSAELKPALIKLLKSMSEPLAKLDNPLYIGGHTDARVFPKNSDRSNWNLSFLRADNARKILEQNGVGERVKRVVAYGSSQPLNVKDPLAPENRRLSILALRLLPPPEPPPPPGPPPVSIVPNINPNFAPVGAPPRADQKDGDKAEGKGEAGKGEPANGDREKAEAHKGESDDGEAKHEAKGASARSEHEKGQANDREAKHEAKGE